MPTVEVFDDKRLTVGESIIWSEAENALYWVDSKGWIDDKGPQIFRRSLDGEREAWAWDHELGALAFRESGGLIVAARDGFHSFDPATGKRSPIVDPEPDKPTNRLNDGRVDRQGRFWSGTLSTEEPKANAGKVYCLERDLTVTPRIEPCTLPNSICFSPDGRTMYFGDTGERMIWAFEFDVDDGVPHSRRLFADCRDRPGMPDGSIVDADGCVWNAEWQGGCLTRYTPDGRIDMELSLPVSRPTCAAFGGPRLDTLFITTTQLWLTEEELAREPRLGMTFVTSVPGVTGLPEEMFRG